MDMSMDAPKAGKWRKAVIGLVVGGLAGGLCSFALLSLADSGALGQLGPSREIAALVGLLYLVIGLFVEVGVLSPRIGARFLNVEDADELREQRKLLAGSALGLVALGLALLILALAEPAGIVPASTALVISVALIALFVVLSVRQRRLVDELMLALSNEAGSLAFYLTALAGGGWAALAHVGFAAGPAPLDWLTLTSAMLLLASFIVAGRRGLLAPR